MYYKILNKECEVYKKLHELRTKELQIGIENEKAIKEKVVLEYKTFLGQSGQQNFDRVTRCDGFAFLKTENVDLDIWKEHRDYKGIYIPNKKTKQGKEMAKFLSSGLKRSSIIDLFDILGFQFNGTFTFPFLEIKKDVIILYLGSSQEPTDKNIIEITKKEFTDLSDLV